MDLKLVKHSRDDVRHLWSGLISTHNTTLKRGTSMYEAGDQVKSSS